MNKEINPDDIVNVICEHFEITKYELFRKNRKKEIITARHYFFFLCRQLTKLSLSDIGLISLNYGRKIPFDHATVLHGKNKISDLISTYKEDKNLAVYLINRVETSNFLFIVNDVDLLEMCLT